MSLMEKGDSEAQPTYGVIFQFKNTFPKYLKFGFDPLPRSCEKIQKKTNTDFIYFLILRLFLFPD